MVSVHDFTQGSSTAMAQIIDPLPSGSPDRLLCCYVNATSKIQIARITNVPSWYFERVVFPGQRLLFEAIDEALLEIHCGVMASSILSDTIPCDRLRIEAELDATFEDLEINNAEFEPDATALVAVTLAE